MPLVITEIASALESDPDGDLSFVRPSAVTPYRSSRKTVTTRRISSSAEEPAGSSSEEASVATAAATIATSSSSLVGQRHDDGIEAAAQGRGEFVDALVAVVGGRDDIEARTAWTSCPAPEIGRVFSDKT